MNNRRVRALSQEAVRLLSEYIRLVPHHFLEPGGEMTEERIEKALRRAWPSHKMRWRPRWVDDTRPLKPGVLKYVHLRDSKRYVLEMS